MNLHAWREQGGVSRVGAASVSETLRIHRVRDPQRCCFETPSARQTIFPELIASRPRGALSTARSTHP